MSARTWLAGSGLLALGVVSVIVALQLLDLVAWSHSLFLGLSTLYWAGVAGAVLSVLGMGIRGGRVDVLRLGAALAVVVGTASAGAAAGVHVLALVGPVVLAAVGIRGSPALRRLRPFAPLLAPVAGVAAFMLVVDRCDLAAIHYAASVPLAVVAVAASWAWMDAAVPGDVASHRAPSPTAALAIGALLLTGLLPSFLVLGFTWC